MRVSVDKANRSVSVLSFVRPYEFTDMTVDFTLASEKRVNVAVNWSTPLTEEMKKRVLLKTKRPGLPGKDLQEKNSPGPRPLGVDIDEQEESILHELDSDAPDKADDGTVNVEDLRKLKHCLGAQGIHIEELSPVAVTSVTTDKVTYKPGEKGSGTATVKNFSVQPVKAVVRVAVEHGLDSAQDLGAHILELAPGEAEDCARAEVEGWPVHEGRATFAVTTNFWETALASVARISPTSAKNMAGGKDGLCTVLEYFFWAPDNFGDLTPDKERFFGGQLQYAGSTSATQETVAAAHKRGIAAVVYADMWGGDGPPAFELMRKHPNWFLGAGCKTYWMEKWPLMEKGKIPVMKVWPYTTVDWQDYQNCKEAMEYHASELVASHRQFGWDGVRYDSYYATGWVKRGTEFVRKAVERELPEFRFAYNCPKPWTYPEMVETMVSGGGFVMEEAAKGVWGSPSSMKGYANLLMAYRDHCWQAGGHFGVITGGGKETSELDRVYLSSIVLASGAHPYGRTAYNRFALRYSEFIYNNRMRGLDDPDKRVRFGGDQKLFLWERFARTLDLGDGRRRLVLHLINPPAVGVTCRNFAQRTTEPIKDLPLSVSLPTGAKPIGAWLLDPEAHHQRLECDLAEGKLEMTVPCVRFWKVLVIDYEAQEGP